MRIGLGKYFMTGKISVTNFPVAVFPSALFLKGGLMLKADSGNAGIVFVSDSGVNAGSAYPLQPGVPEFFHIDEVSGVFLLASAGTQKVTWFAS